jgi:hypothetical protein
MKKNRTKSLKEKKDLEHKFIHLNTSIALAKNKLIATENHLNFLKNELELLKKERDKVLHAM